MEEVLQVVPLYLYATCANFALAAEVCPRDREILLTVELALLEVNVKLDVAADFANGYQFASVAISGRAIKVRNGSAAGSLPSYCARLPISNINCTRTKCKHILLPLCFYYYVPDYSPVFQDVRIVVIALRNFSHNVQHRTVWTREALTVKYRIYGVSNIVQFSGAV